MAITAPTVAGPVVSHFDSSTSRTAASSSSFDSRPMKRNKGSVHMQLARAHATSLLCSNNSPAGTGIGPDISLHRLLLIRYLRPQATH